MTSANAVRLFSDAFDAEVDSERETHPDSSAWSVAGKGKVKSRPNGEDEVWWRVNGPKMVQRWMDWRKQSGWKIWTTPDGTPAIELPIETSIPGHDNELWMVIDRVFQHPSGALIIIDLKTGARSPESDLQLGVYRYGLQHEYGVDADLGAYWMAREGQLTDLFGLQRYQPHLLEAWFQTLITAKASNIFLPHVTFRCRACPVRDYCAAFGGSQSHLDPDNTTGGKTP